ncbi:MAG TPA: RdgB/HAM1 family non-canonical purine NTP pyrophosphatase [Ferruginibacter sp.]|nr:RdgB/HAM1 family non-canonical purine NTP pyrophosphatase [Ferruginibacter sp.]
MIRSLIFATNNKHKADEIKYALKNGPEILTLKEAGINIDIPEPHDTLEKNATEKSIVIYNLTGKNCFSEDTGLEVLTLNGEPGVRSARYAGDGNSKSNIKKLLQKLGENKERKARFRTIISLQLDKKEYQFEGICEGKITHAEKGMEGFGYDSIFIPDGSNKTFAEMGMNEKTLFSHRKKAIDKLIHFLKRYYEQDKA